MNPCRKTFSKNYVPMAHISISKIKMGRFIMINSLLSVKQDNFVTAFSDVGFFSESLIL